MSQFETTTYPSPEATTIGHKTLGDSRKYPYPTMDGINILISLAFGNSKML